MASNVANYDFGGGGIQLVKNPLHLADNEATQLQNAELVLNETTGGAGALSKRGGLAVLNSSAMSGSVTGILPLTLLTSYTRTLYIAKGTEDSTTFVTTTDGTTLTNSTTSPRLCDFDKYTDENNARNARRMISFRNFIVYAGNNYTQDTDNPEITVFDGTTGTLVARIPVGPSSNGNPPFVITDMITANGLIYFAVHDPGGSGANLCGRVMSLDLETGVIKQIATAFGGGTNEMSGGAPSCLVFYQSQLWVGLNGSATTDGIGKIVRCYPSIDTSWTADVSNLVSHVSSLCAFSGDLYAGTQSSISTGAKIYKRTASTGAWAAVATSGGGAGGSGHYASIYEHSSALYAVEFHTTTPIVHIVTSADGTTWTTSRDVDANDSGTAALFPGSMLTLGSDLLVVFRSTDINDNDGFLMRLRSGTWSKLATDNYAGPLAVLVTKA